MNQSGFVEISLVKNDHLYRACLPMGVPWTDVHEALLELAQQVQDHIEFVKQKQAESEDKAESEDHDLIQAEIVEDQGV